MTDAQLKTVFTMRHKQYKNVTVTEVHGMQNLDMKSNFIPCFNNK